MTRIHTVLFDQSTNRFATLGLDPTAALKVNPKWAPYSQACVETWELAVRASQWVLRAHLRCCCSGACPYGHGIIGYAAVSAVPSTLGTPRTSPHGRDAAGPSYIEATIGAGELITLQTEAKAVAVDVAARSRLGTTLAADAATFGLTDADLDGELQDAKMIDAPAAATVFAGTSAVANDYYAVATLLKLHQRLVTSAHSRLTRDWPQRGDNEPTRLEA